MSTSSKVRTVAVAGVLLFCLGVWLDHIGIGISVSGVTEAQSSFGDFGKLGNATQLTARGGEFMQIAQILLWTGGALIVLSAATWLYLCINPRQQI